MPKDKKKSKAKPSDLGRGMAASSAKKAKSRKDRMSELLDVKPRKGMKKTKDRREGR